MAASETRFDALGRSWRFKFGFGAICRLEADYDRPIARILQAAMPELAIADMADPDKVAEASLDVRITDIRAILHAGIVEDATEADVNEIMDELGAEGIRPLVAMAFKQDIAPPRGGPGRANGKKTAAARRS